MTTATRSHVSAGATGDIADLLPRASDGDPVAWEEIVRRYGKSVSVTVRSFQPQDADALDAVQMTWLRLAENAHRVQLPERLGGWLTTTARRECLHLLRPRAKPASEPPPGACTHPGNKLAALHVRGAARPHHRHLRRRNHDNSPGIRADQQPHSKPDPGL